VYKPFFTAHFQHFNRFFPGNFPAGTSLKRIVRSLVYLNTNLDRVTGTIWFPEAQPLTISSLKFENPKSPMLIEVLKVKGSTIH